MINRFLTRPFPFLFADLVYRYRRHRFNSRVRAAFTIVSYVPVFDLHLLHTINSKFIHKNIKNINLLNSVKVLTNHYLIADCSMRERAIIYFHSLDRLSHLFNQVNRYSPSFMIVWSYGAKNSDQFFYIRLSMSIVSSAEGAIAFELLSDNELIHRMSFSIIPCTINLVANESIIIGGNQGYGSLQSRNLFSKFFFNISPERVLLVSVKSFAAALKIKSIYGVSANAHPNSLIGVKLSKTLYDQFWLSNDGVEKINCYQLPLEFTRDESFVPKGRHKKQKYLQRKILDELGHSVTKSFFSHEFNSSLTTIIPFSIY